jgi:Cu(I)/Ag(I) efflux system protein CusF
MKTSLFCALLAATALSACGTQEAPSQTAASALVEHTSADAATPTEATASGTVESVDAATGRIVISHGPVESLDWPAMTMGFKATPEQIQSVQPGQQVEFAFTASGMEASITRIDPRQVSSSGASRPR